jgi:hypothetical protein
VERKEGRRKINTQKMQRRCMDCRQKPGGMSLALHSQPGTFLSSFFPFAFSLLLFLPHLFFLFSSLFNFMFSAAIENIAYFLHFPVKASDSVLYVKKKKN